MEGKRVPFVQYLERIRDQEDRGALAALRRGLGKQPGLAPEMYRYVAPWLGDSKGRRESTYYLVAALFAYHPKPGGRGSFGEAMARVVSAGASGSSEIRFSALLKSHPDDLATRLRHCISLARSREVPVDWHRLFRDIMGWQHHSRYVQRSWARDFWARAVANSEPEEADAVSSDIGEELA